MHFGMPTLIENKCLEENIALCKELGLQFLELNMNLPEYQIEYLERVSHFTRLAKLADLYYTIHLDENLNLADFNHSIANAYMETVKRTIVVAKSLGVPIITMHMNHGVHFTLPEKKVYLYKQYFESYINAFREFRRMCEEEIGDCNIKICIENTDGFHQYEKSAILYLLQSKVFGLTWDIGHSNSSGNVDEPFLLQNEGRLTHFHIHDSLGKKDHMTLGTGEIDLKQRLDIAKQYGCRCVIETKTIETLRQSMYWLKKFYS